MATQAKSEKLRGTAGVPSVVVNVQKYRKIGSKNKIWKQKKQHKPYQYRTKEHDQDEPAR